MFKKLKTVLVALLLSNGIFAQDVNLPDNINLDPCFGEVPASEWKTPTCQTSPGNNYMALSSVRVGDVDGDGYPEIVTSNYGNQVYIVDGRTLNVKNQFTAESMYAEGVNAIAKIKWSDTEEKTVVYCFNTTGFLLLYSVDGIGGRLCYSPQLYPSNGEVVIYSAFSNVVDLDGDGWSEIVVGNKVLAAENLNLLCTLGSNQGAVQSWGSYNDAYQSSVADIDGDGKQEVCIGNEIYRVTVNSRTNGGATPELVKHIDHPTDYPDDGCTQIVDLDADGYLDVVISTAVRGIDDNSHFYFMYVYSPHKDEIIAKTDFAGNAIYGHVYKHSLPFIGDLDGAIDPTTGKKYPEIVFMNGRCSGNHLDSETDMITAVKYVPEDETGSHLDILWQIGHSDLSGVTGITLFDFNQDGAAELVYRDEYELKIIDGTNHETLASFPCYSATCFEYPVVADVDGDGYAEIVTVGFETSIGDGLSGPIRVFRPDNSVSPWAPARKVWNQYGYNSVCVNEDLTIPATQFNSATFFPGEDGLLGTDDDIQPFNNFLQQQTMLNYTGLQTYLLPDLSMKSLEFDVPTRTAHVVLENKGGAKIGPNIKVAVYGEDVTVDPYEVINIEQQLNEYETVNLDILIDEHFPYPTLTLIMNYDGTEYGFEECDYSSNTISTDFIYSARTTDDNGETWSYFASLQSAINSVDNVGKPSANWIVEPLYDYTKLNEYGPNIGEGVDRVVVDGKTFTLRSLSSDYNDGLVSYTAGTNTFNISGFDGTFFVVKSGSVTVKNLVIDGGDAEEVNHRAFRLEGGKLILSADAKIKNVKSPNLAPAVYVKDESAVLEITSGAEISGNAANPEYDYGVIYQNGTMNLSGNPVFGTNDVVYLAEGKVITKAGDVDGSVLVPVKVEDESNGRDILVSSTGHNVVKSDLSLLNVMLENADVPRLAVGFTSVDVVNPVIELFACLWSQYVIACPATGYSETDGNATISSKEGLAWLISVVNGLNGQTANDFSGKTVTLTQNVNMADHIWEAIGTDAHPFKGTFTSNGSTIKGLNNNADYGVAGLFGTVKGTVSNAFVEDCNFVANPDAGAYYGIIANTVNGGTVHSSEAMGTLEAANANAHIGGVVGIASGSSEVHSVISYATLTGSDKGGIVNKLDGSKLSNSYAKFSTFAENKELVATNNSGTVANCYYVNGTTQMMNDSKAFSIPTAYGYGISGCMTEGARMVDKLNSWATRNDAYATWAQPFTADINGDCPVLKLKSFNTMASKASTAPYLYYGDLDNQLSNESILFYGRKDNSTATYEGNGLYIDQDAALKSSGSLKVNASVVFDNSDASGFSGGNYDWHMFSTPLTDAPLGINYDGYVNAGTPYGSPSQVVFNNPDGYFPTNTPYGSWDFYCYSEPYSSWINYKRNTGDHFDTYTGHNITADEFKNETKLIAGKGYLAAIDKESVLQAKGTLNKTSVDRAATHEGHHVTGCNFIGNPYHAYLDFDQFCGSAGNSILASQSYAMIDADKKGYVYYTKEGSKNEDQGPRYIHPHQGFIVKVSEAGTLSFTPDMAVVDETSAYRVEHFDYPLVNLFATDSDGVRETVTAELGRPANGGALKIDGLQMGKCTMSISNQGERYGIAFVEGQPDEVAVHFHAIEDGDFTMSWNTHNGTFSYLHLIDNMTGMDIDCLASDEYRFTAHTGDYASRFKLKFEFTGVDENTVTESEQTFAFFHQGNLVVNGQGNLELVDLSGRVLMTKILDGGQSTVALPEVSEGLYLLRLAGESNVKTQKIIIK